MYIILQREITDEIVEHVVTIVCLSTTGLSLTQSIGCIEMKVLCTHQFHVTVNIANKATVRR